MALAPEQVGIGIRRYFTEPGVHPYDTLEWERREARIPNWKDGTDAFRQDDVEFPVTWSQNATNIVAQKYFRGTLGTEERETSLRQVIDRVADTITSWGVKDGYFADEAEGAAFRNELKYLLVTQRAAKMVILNADHPDVEEFIWCKSIEEQKARALRDAGFDMDLDGRDSHSIQYQNANNSVRVTDAFMQAVEADADWHLTSVTSG